jgi:Holliday junction resolvasome RuvABC endonuclease subunit
LFPSDITCSEFTFFVNDNKERDGVETITPMQVKKIIGGSGKAGKDVVRNSLEKYIPDYNNIVWNSFDESDSVAVGISYFLLMESHINEQK